MAVEMGIQHRKSGRYEVVPVATAEAFRTIWLPAAEQLGLELVPLFSGGALTTVPPELIPRITSELTQLRDYAATQPDGDYLATRCRDILSAFDRTDPAESEYDFG